MSSRNEQVLASYAARLDAVAGFCGIRRLALRPEGNDTVALVGDRDGVTLTLRVQGVGKRSVRTTLVLDAPGIPVDLKLRPELAGEGFDKALGMTVDAEVGDPAFDARFVVEAAPHEAARQLLVAPVRRALLAIPSDHEFPIAALRDGFASITWAREPDPMMLTHALEALEQIRLRARELREGLRDVVPGAVFRQGSGAEQTVDPGEREAARSRFKSAKARAVVVIGSAVAAGVGFIVSVIFGQAV